MLPLPILGLFLPFLLWPVEMWLPFPHFAEEIAKALSILLIYKDRKNIREVILFGVSFALSESIFYVFNIAAVGNLSTLFLRLALTIPLHAGTSVAIYKLRFWGIPVAIGIHYLFNLLIFLRIV